MLPRDRQTTNKALTFRSKKKKKQVTRGNNLAKLIYGTIVF